MTSPTPAVWDELCVVTDLCLSLHRCAVQASGRAMALMVAQERARWLNLSSLSQKEKTQLLDVLWTPKACSAQRWPPCKSTVRRRRGKAKHFSCVYLEKFHPLPPCTPFAPNVTPGDTLGAKKKKRAT